MKRPIELTAETLWNEVAGRLKGALNETTYRTWFAEAEGHELTDDAFVLGVPNDGVRLGKNKAVGAVNGPSARKHRLKLRFLAGLDAIGDKHRLRFWLCGTMARRGWRGTASQCEKRTGE